MASQHLCALGQSHEGVWEFWVKADLGLSIEDWLSYVERILDTPVNTLEVEEPPMRISSGKSDTLVAS